jgi:hypothetical protein
MAETTEAQQYAASWEQLARLERRRLVGMGSALTLLLLTLVLTAWGLRVGNYLMWPFFVAAAVGVTSHLQRASVRCPRCDRFFLRATSDHARCAECGLERDAPAPEGR